MVTLRSQRNVEGSSGDSKAVTDIDNNNSGLEDTKKRDGDKKLEDEHKRTTRVVILGLILDLLAFTLILPLFPSLITHYKNNDSSGLFSYLETKVEGFRVMVGAPSDFNSVLFGGLLGSMFSFLQFLSSPVVGGLSDRFGRRPLLLVSTIGIAFSYLVWVLSSNFTMFVIARIIGGISKGNVSLSTAIITDVSSPATRGKGMALIGVAFSLGFLFGPIIGAAFSLWGKGQQGDWFIYPAFTALALSVLDVLYLAACFKESLPEHKRTKSTKETLNQVLLYLDPVKLFNFSSLTNLEKEKINSLKKVGLAYFLYLFLYSGMEFTLTFLTHLRFNFTSMQQGKMFFFIGIVMSVLQGGIVRRIPSGKEKTAAIWALLVIVPSFSIVGMSYSLVSLYSGVFLYAVSTAFTVPCLTTMVSQYGEHHQKGIIMGVFRSLGALGRAFGPIFGSFLYWSLGPDVAYSLSGALLLVPFFILKSIK